MKLKKFKALIGTSLTLFTSFFVGNIAPTKVEAYPYTYSHFSTFEPQAKFYWCWAACALMSGREANPSTTLTQEDVVFYVKNNTNNTTATISETITAANYVANGNASYSYASGSMLNEFFVSQFLHNNVPIVQNNSVNIDGSLSSTSHLVIPYTITFASSTDVLLSYYDPQGGVYRTVNMTDFINGTAVLYGNHKVKYTGTIYHN